MSVEIVSRHSFEGIEETEPASYTDDFEAYSEGALATQGDWIALIAAWAVVDYAGDNCVYGNDADIAGCIYNDIFADDQYSEITFVTASSGYYNGVGVRLSGSGATAQGYAYVGGTSDSYLLKITDGDFAVVGSTGDAIDADDVLRIEVSGTTISCYKNDILDTSVGTSGQATDSDYSSGKAGLFSFGVAGNYITSWAGGDL